MSITTEQKNDVLFVRFTSDLLTLCDSAAIQGALQKALSNGTRNIALSVTVGSLSNQRSVSRLLRQSREAVRNENGNLFLVELNNEENSAYHSICDSLHIPLYDSEEKIDAAIAVPVAV